MKEYFTIGETARLNNISIQTLRYHDRIGVFKPSFSAYTFLPKGRNPPSYEHGEESSGTYQRNSFGYCWGTYRYLLYMVFSINKPIMVYLN